jgi:hypothetical protein
MLKESIDYMRRATADPQPGTARMPRHEETPRWSAPGTSPSRSGRGVRRVRSGHAEVILEHVFGDAPSAPPPRRPGDDRRVRPPRPVWVDLSRLYPVAGPIRPFPEGWDLQARVPGELTAWLRTTTGEWVAQVRFRVRRGDDSEGVMHTGWLPASAVAPREDAPARRRQAGL